MSDSSRPPNFGFALTSFIRLSNFLATSSNMRALFGLLLSSRSTRMYHQKWFPRTGFLALLSIRNPSRVDSGFVAPDCEVEAEGEGREERPWRV